jgi:hypothetical protein
MNEFKVEVRGIRELGSAFRKVDRELGDELKIRFTAVAQRIVSAAQQRMPHVSGKAAESVKARGRQSGASIAFGGQAAPYMPWLDFGGSVGRGHVPGKAWSGAIKREWLGRPRGMGRYVYPAISEAKDETAKAVEYAVSGVARRAGFDVSGF